MHSEKPGKYFKNGLSIDQVESAKSLLKKVNVAKITRKHGLKNATIYNVLRDESPHVDQLNIVLRDAAIEAAAIENALSSFPL